jgi:hypothetical protein
MGFINSDQHFEVALNVTKRPWKIFEFLIFIFYFYIYLMSIYTPDINIITQDLVAINPTSPLVLPDPYQENKVLDDNIGKMFQYLQRMLRRKDRIMSLAIAYYIGQAIECRSTTTVDRTLCYRKLTPYYKDCCLRIYTIFEPLGVEQIYRTKEVTVGLFRKIKKKDVDQLITTAMNEMNDRFSQELED